MVEIKKRHTAVNLCKEIEEILKNVEFEKKSTASQPITGQIW